MRLCKRGSSNCASCFLCMVKRGMNTLWCPLAHGTTALYPLLARSKSWASKQAMAYALDCLLLSGCIALCMMSFGATYHCAAQLPACEAHPGVVWHYRVALCSDIRSCVRPFFAISLRLRTWPLCYSGRVCPLNFACGTRDKVHLVNYLKSKANSMNATMWSFVKPNKGSLPQEV